MQLADGTILTCPFLFLLQMKMENILPALAKSSFITSKKHLIMGYIHKNEYYQIYKCDIIEYQTPHQKSKESEKPNSSTQEEKKRKVCTNIKAIPEKMMPSSTM